MEPRKNSSLNEERNDRDHAGLSSETSRMNDEGNVETRNVAQNIEEGDEDYDDEEGELEESDFDIDDDDEEEGDDDEIM
jgi:hypothetical protein